VVRYWAPAQDPREVTEDLGRVSQTVVNRARWADRDDGCTTMGLTAAEREELRRLRREVRGLQGERETLRKPRLNSQGRPIAGEPHRLVEAEKAHHPVSPWDACWECRARGSTPGRTATRRRRG
jgi:hypothetical protein